MLADKFFPLWLLSMLWQWLLTCLPVWADGTTLGAVSDGGGVAVCTLVYFCFPFDLKCK